MTNKAVFDAAVQVALEVLPLEFSMRGAEVSRRVDASDRVAGAMRHVELSLVDALLPIVRDEVESGRLALPADDDYLTLSARLVELLVSEWLVIDLRD